ncbi:hypothetical protein MKX01_003731 [Papaver californicum]|nr:hypothetical protein MKX01_003731 [Papaver californicum]
MSSPNDWLHIYERNYNQTGDKHQPQQPVHHQDMFGRHHAVSDAPVVTTNNVTNSASNIFSNSSTDQMNLMGDGNCSNSSSSSSTSTHLNPERRVSKPIRRRRASRGAPVTLLNTDASNFRAMVQQFTGVPSPPFSLASINNNPDHAAGGVLAGTNLNFQLPPHSWFQQHQDPSSNNSSSSSVMQQQHQQ